jgi:hypothetical protein
VFSTPENFLETAKCLWKDRPEFRILVPTNSHQQPSAFWRRLSCVNRQSKGAGGSGSLPAYYFVPPVARRFC